MRYSSFTDIDSDLRRLCEIEIAMANIDGEITLQINAIKEKYKSQSEALQNEANFIRQEIEQFCENNKHEFANKRSKELVFGIIGYRVSKSVSLPRNKDKLKALLSSIKKFGLQECITYEEKPNKDALVELDDTSLVKLGLKRIVKDNFRIEPKIESLEIKDAL